MRIKEKEVYKHNSLVPLNDLHMVDALTKIYKEKCYGTQILVTVIQDE